MLVLGYILVPCHKNNIVKLRVTFMLYRRNKTCLLGYIYLLLFACFGGFSFCYLSSDPTFFSDAK